MQGIKILHMADMHLGSAFSGLGSEFSRLRQSEHIHTCIKTICEAKDCHLVLLPGDVFDDSAVSFSVVDSFLGAVASLGNIPVFYSCGNHDSYYSPVIKYCIDNSPENLYIFPPDKISCYTLDNYRVRIYGSSFSTESCEASLLDDISDMSDSYLNILCMHGDVTPGKYNFIDIKRLQSSMFSYAALGHIHTYSGIRKSGECFYAYPGVPEGRGFDECGEKGYIKGYISKTEISLAFHPASSRRYIDDKIDISDFKNEYELIDVINSFCEQGNEICRFVLIGDNNFGKTIDVKTITGRCKSPYCQCIDKTRLTLHPEDYVGYPGLKGICASETIELINNSSDKDDIEDIKKAFAMLINLFENR